MVSFRTDLLFFGALSLGIYIYCIYINICIYTGILRYYNIYIYISVLFDSSKPHPATKPACLPSRTWTCSNASAGRGTCQGPLAKGPVEVWSVDGHTLNLHDVDPPNTVSKKNNKYFVLAPVIFMLATNWISFLMA